MSNIHPIPKKDEVRLMLAMLFGGGLAVENGKPVVTAKGGKSVVAVYVNDEKMPVTACACDHPFAAFAGAALSRIPAGVAKDAVKSGEFSEMMLGNLYEIMNICSRLFMDNSSPHLKLDAVYATPDKMPDNALAMVAAATGRLDLAISIPGYGSGSLSFLAT